MAAFAFGTVSKPEGLPKPALLVGGRIAIIEEVATAALGRSPSMLALLSDWDAAVEMGEAVAARLEDGNLSGPLYTTGDIRIHAPHEPRQVFCTGANYHRHVVEIICDRFGEKKMRDEGWSREQLRGWAEAMMDRRAREGQPYIFSRTVSSYAGPFDDLILPSYATEPDWEAELAVVFKSGGIGISQGEAMSHVAGYMVVNDITNRDQIFTADPPDLGSDWLHAKNNPGYFPMGPWIVPAHLVPDPHKLRITLTLNGNMMQDERTDDMIFDIPRQIETLTKYTRIFPGDVLATGSPAGNGTHHGRYLRPGDVMEVSVEGLGTQTTRCVAPC